MNYICTSVLDIFKIGPGPSNSHTIGSMKAAGAFLEATRMLSEEKLAQAARLDVHLYGSLSATGKGHGTDKAVTAGLLGIKPETCDADFVSNIFADANDEYMIKLGEREFIFGLHNIIFEFQKDLLKYQNTLEIKLLGKSL